MKIKTFFQLSIIFCYILGMNLGVAATQSLDQIIATVNDSPIMQSELNEAMNTIKKQMMSMRAPLPSNAALHKQVLEQLINRKLELELAAQSGIHASDADVDRVINNIAKENKFSVAELYQQVAAQGLNRNNYRKEIQDAIVLQQLQQQQVGPKVVITPEEIKDFVRSKAWQTSTMKEYHLEDILIALPETPTPSDIATAKKQAEELLAKLRKGMDFKTAMAESGNDLGWRKLPEIPTAFANELSEMKQNDIAGPLQTSNGFHLIRLAGIRNVPTEHSASPSPKQIEQMLYQRKFEAALQSWVAKLRSEAVINLRPENE